MAHFAQLDTNNIVLNVIVVNNEVLVDTNGQENEDIGVSFCKSLFGSDTIWKQTSYNSTFRKNFASKGFIYDSEKDAFIPPKPYESWTLNETTYLWDPPVPMPNDGTHYTWNEGEQIWVEVQPA